MQVLKYVGLGLLDKDEMKAMFDQCDDNASGRVDFAEFLKTVVGNLTGI
jgi:Ca2+-binding EF-hand superfamily protein